MVVSHRQLGREAVVLHAADGRVPLLLGVTGHVTIRENDASALRASVVDLIVRLRHIVPSTPLMLLTSLAEGADMLVSDCADKAGIPLVAVLPKPPEEYRRDFHRPESPRLFDRLLGAAVTVITTTAADDVAPVSDNSSGLDTDTDAYRRAGAYVAKYAQLVIALWDGESVPSSETALAVEFVLNGVPPPYDYRDGPLSAPENRAVYHIATPREGAGTASVVQAGQGRWRYSEAPGDESDDWDGDYGIWQVCREIDTFNQNALDLRSSPAVARGSTLLPDETLTRSAPVIQRLHAVFLSADRLASQAKRQILWSWATLAALVITGTAALTYQSYFPTTAREAAPWMIVGALILAIAVVYRNIVRHRFRYQDKHQDYRSLAEGLRVQIFWYLGGVPESAARYYLTHHKVELGWIRYSVQVWEALAGGAAKAAQSSRASDEARVMSEIRRRWLVDQAGYYDSASRRNKAAAERFDRLSEKSVVAYLLLTFFAGVALFALDHRLSARDSDHLHITLECLGAFMIALAAVLHTWSDKMAFSAHGREYEKMRQRFDVALERSEEYLRTGDAAKMRELIHILGKECLIENAEWVMLHRDKEIDLPAMA